MDNATMNNKEMDLTSISVIKNLLKARGIYPSKKLGQNFLISRMVLKKIIETADIQKTDTILEIGPGIGTLTQELAKKAGKVIAIEKDKKLVEILKETLKDFKNVEIINGDILKMNKEQRTIKKKGCSLPAPSAKPFSGFTVHCSLFADYKVVANLPYYITSPVIRKFLEIGNPPSQMILMIQKEVAQRIVAKPPKMSILTISVQFYAKPEIISYVSKNSFWPPPQVNSAVIKIVPRYSAYRSALFSERFFRIVKAGFSHPRKQLAKNLINELELNRENTCQWLLKNKINPTQRAETLNLQDWLNLAKTFKNTIIEQ